MAVLSHQSPAQLAEVITSKTIACILGLLTHLVIAQGEWDFSSHLLVVFWTISYLTITFIGFTLNPNSLSSFHVIQASSCFAGVYFVTLIISILTYRGFFHRLRNFPGPFGARFTKLHTIYNIIPNFQNYKVVEKWHKRYGSDIIRTGPRELSIARADAISLIHGPLSKCIKGPMYNGAKPIEGLSLQTTRSKADHSIRRKVWNRAFSVQSLRDYEPRVDRHTRLLIAKLRERSNEQRIRISDWMAFYSFDIMGDIGFSRTFGMVEKGEKDSLIEKLHKGMAPFSIITHAVWSLAIILRTRLGSKDLLGFIDWTRDMLRERNKITPKEKDVFGWLLDPDQEEIPFSLNADARLLVIAGSDTTSATMTWAFYELCANSTIQTTLRNIVNEIAPGKCSLNAEDLSTCTYLDNVINETLRLHPALPSGVQRLTPPEGLILPSDGTFIPGSTIVWMPTHVIHRDPRYFSSPLTFDPLRWDPSVALESKDGNKADRSAFHPFGRGPYDCVGQKLAMIEMRSVIANVIRNFDIEFAEGEDGSGLAEKTRDTITLSVGPLDAKLTPRKEVRD